MPTVPPSTVSAGRLVVLYTNTATGVQHGIGANFKGDVLPAVSTIRDTAISFATACAAMSIEATSFTEWKITDLDGAFLYGETFEDVINGTIGLGDANKYSDSFSVGARGKGVGPTIGIGVGTTRSILFTGYYNSDAWTGRFLDPGTAGFISALRDFLDGSLIVGADKYGQGAEYRVNYTVQMNAHYQKRYGI